jgi:hypothetical protein
VNPPGWDWTAARSATVHCLIGCSIGEVLGMVIGQSAGWGNLPTIALSVALAFVFGILLATIRITRLGLTGRQAVRIAAAAEFLSISTMELVDNAVLLALPGVLAAGLGTVTFWAAMAFALAVAFVVTVPVNAWLIARGRGHAVVPHHHPAAVHH